jgi:DNA-binding response OmpR family regulator
MKTILIIDDKTSVRVLVKDYLSKEGFRVVEADNGQNGLYVARQEKPDLILLDIMMPEMDGFEFMRVFGKEGDIPIILLTAKVDETDKVLGLEFGADDYVTKPFSMRELLARIRAVLRRSEKTPAATVLRFGSLVMDPTSHEVTLDEQPVHLTPTEFDLLALMMAAPGRVYSRTDLLEHLQGIAFEGIERTVDVHIRNLRAKIDPDTTNPRFIETVFGIGYRFRKATGG